MMLRNPISTMRQSALGRSFQQAANPTPTVDTWSPEAEDEMQGIWDKPQQQPASDASMFYDEIRRVQNENSPGLSAYRAALQNVPQSQDYRPSGWTRVAAGLSGLSAGLKDAGRGIQVAQDLNRSDYANAMEEYSSRLGTLQEQAKLEEADKRSRLEAIYKAGDLGMNYLKYLQSVKHEQAQDAASTRSADARVMSAEAAKEAAAKKTYDYQPVVGGYVAINRNDPNDRIPIQAQTLQEAQLKVAQGNLDVARGNLAVNQGELTNAQRRTDIANTQLGLNASREGRENVLEPRRVAAQEANAGVIQPTQQDAARSLAQKELMDDPAFAPFFKTKWGGWSSTPVGPEDFSQSDWLEFQQALDAKTREIMLRRR